MRPKTQVALVQMACSDEPKQNLDKAIAKVQEAAHDGAQIVCLPELFLSPYFCQSKDDKEAFKRAESIPGPTTEVLAKLAKDLGIVLIAGSIFEKSADDQFFNSAAILGPDGSSLGLHRKVHIPEDPLFHEQHYFKSSDEGIRVFETPFGNISVLICFDQWFPEAARLASLQGAEIIFYPTAIGKIDEKVEENITGDWQKMWTHVQLGHAAANNVYIASVNRVGREGDLDFWGASFIADPSSHILTQAKNQECIIQAECDFNKVKEMQEAWGFFRNRKPSAYSLLTK